MKAAAALARPAAIQWRRSIAWLLFLGPFFFLSYGFSNTLAAQLQVDKVIVFGWEKHIPFIPWTILPYWSIDLFYGLSFLLCRTAREVDRHALRLLTAQLVSVSGFVLFPLHYSFVRPPVDGVFGHLFDALNGFDKPYNQAPSLHISLLLIIWIRFARASHGVLRWIVDVWAVLIAVSVLTTYQHHFIDVPTGFAVGLLCLWLWPDSGPPPLARITLTRSRQRWRLAFLYALAAALFCAVGCALGGAGWWLAWVSLSLLLVALNYAALGSNGFQKQTHGRQSFGAALLYAPYTFGAWLNSRAWTRRAPEPQRLTEQVWIGRMPSAIDMNKGGFRALLDLSAELPAPRGNWQYANLPWLDLLPPEVSQLAQAAAEIERLQRNGPLWVCCALGYSRSASAMAAWLIVSGRASSVEEAIQWLERAGQHVVLGEQHRHNLAALAQASDH